MTATAVHVLVLGSAPFHHRLHIRAQGLQICGEPIPQPSRAKVGGGQTCNNERATSICPILFIIFSSLLF